MHFKNRCIALTNIKPAANNNAMPCHADSYITPYIFNPLNTDEHQSTQSFARSNNHSI